MVYQKFHGYHTLLLMNPCKFDSVGLQILGDTEQRRHVVDSRDVVTSAWKPPRFCVTDSHNHTLQCRGAKESQCGGARRKGKRTGAFSWLSVHSAAQVVPDAPVTPSREGEK